MSETISDQELRRRLLMFCSKVPPVTSSTRKVLLKKLENHERNYSNQVNSPPSSDASLVKMNVSNWNLSASEDEDKSSYALPETKKFPNKVPEVQTEKKTPKIFDSSITNILPRDPVMQRPRSNPVTETPYADQAIKRWKDKMMNQSHDTSNISITSQFDLPSPVSSIYSQNSRRYVQPLQRHQGNGYTRNTQYIILLLIGFFVVIFGLYFTSIQSSTVVLPPDILNALCAKKNLQGSECDFVQGKVRKLYSVLVLQVQEKYIKSQCDKSDIEPTVDAQTVFEYISTHENMPSREIDELIELFKTIANTYSDSPIGYDNTSFNISVQPNLPIICAVKNVFTNMFYLILWLGIVALSVVCVYFGICYIASKNEKHQLEVNRLIESTIDLLKQRSQYRPNESYLPIIHVRDLLIAPNERQAKNKIWDEVKQYFTESESRVRSEVQQIDGEDYQVWRWVQPMSPGAVKKVWQGQAFETTEGSMNSPLPSPTSCLKVRHMFGPDSMLGDDCEIRVKDAVLEKCEGVEINHIYVDRSSQEGCVYIKCASTTEAGKGYKQLHGFWYDGKLVTVKFLRLERYHQRFPEAVNAAKPLRPSNNEKRSLQ